MNMKKLHLICNAHIDPIWQWEWDEGIAAAISTFASAVRLAAEFDYIFCHNEAVLYQYVEKYNPALFEEIKRLVREGKWHIAGGWYLQPDCNMPCGESIVRHILTGKEYFKEKFGVFPTTAVNYDSFGHSRGLVQILRKCGQDSYMITRPYINQLALSEEQFIWEGFDGSTVNVVRSCAYNTLLGRAAQQITERSRPQEKYPAGVVLWGVGNHGGGPSRKDLSDIQALQRDSELQIVHSTPENFFSDFESGVIYSESLVHCMPGCYTSMIRVKQKHIELENMLYLAEKICTCASLRGLLRYPSDQLKEAQEDLLVSEFHDILPGTIVAKAEDAALNMMGHGLHILGKLKAEALFALAVSEPSAYEGEYPIIVFNPNPYPFTTEIECELMMADQNWNRDEWTQVEVYDRDRKLPSQTVKEGSTINLDWRKKVVFEAVLKPFDITRFSARMVKGKKRDVAYTSGGDIIFSSAGKKVVIGKNSGLIESYSINGIEYIKGKAFMPVVFDDNADPWGMADAQLMRMGTEPRGFHLMEEPCGIFDGLNSVEIIEDGEVYLGVESLFSLGDTKIRIGYKLYRNNPYIDIDVNVFWHEKDKMLKLQIPVCNEGVFIGQSLYGTEKLNTDGRECVAQRYCAIDDGKKSFAVLNNCIYGCSFHDNSIFLSLARGAAYCAHPIEDRELLPPKKYVHRMDQAQLNYNFRITVCDTDALERESQEFNQKPYALNMFPTGMGDHLSGEDTAALINENKNIVLSVAKLSNGSSGCIFRLYNSSEKEQTTVLKIGDACISLSFERSEIKTVRFVDGGFVESDEIVI